MANVNLSPASTQDSIYESRPVEASAAAAQPVKAKGLKVAPLPAALLALFLFAQLFDYHALRLSTFTPDKIFFFLLLLFLSPSIRPSIPDGVHSLVSLARQSTHCANQRKIQGVHHRRSPHAYQRGV